MGDDKEKTKYSVTAHLSKKEHAWLSAHAKRQLSNRAREIRLMVRSAMAKEKVEQEKEIMPREEPSTLVKEKPKKVSSWDWDKGRMLSVLD